ncbi:MAG TPA: extracellular solute-binding protein [Clostridiales bacterium]|nr:extracellular solute-binding protein [Clostridiales bacterium]
MRKWKKTTALLLCMALMGGLAAGCSNKTGDSKAEPTTAAGAGSTDTTQAGKEESAGAEGTLDFSGVKLVFAQDLGTDETANAVVNEIIDAYEAKTGATIQFEALPPADYRTWLTTQFTAGEGPDVYTGILYDITTDYNSGWLYNFADLYKAESPYDTGHIWKDTLPEYILNRMYITENDIPGYPSSTSVVRIFCNTKLFEKAGAQIPTTWAEFVDACKKLKDAGITPFGFPNASFADLSWLWFNNSITSQLNNGLVTTLDETGNGYVELNEIVKGFEEGKLDFTSSSILEGYKLMKEFSDYWTSDYNGLDQATAINMFIRGEVAMVQALSTNLSAVDAVVSEDFEYAVMPVPTITKDTSANAMGKSVILGGQPDIIYAINKDLETDETKLAAAIDFSQYMSSPEVQKKLAETIYRIPLATTTELPENLQGFIITEEPLRLAYYTGINEKLRTYFHRAGQQYLEGSIDVDQLGVILNDAYSEVLKEIELENGWTADNNYGIQ